MPKEKNVKPKGYKRPLLQYDRSKIEDALGAIRGDQISIREASRKYGVPRGTLQDRLHGRVPENKNMGRDTTLTKEEEESLVQWLSELAKCGFSRKKDDLLNTVQKIMKDDKRPNPFTNDRPGRKWYDLFIKRHPILNERVPEGISKGRAVVTEEYIRKWFSDLKKYLTEINAIDLLEDPRRILNGDETSFSVCPKTGKVIAPKGWKNVYEIQAGNEKETITVLLVFTAAGDTLQPMVVFPYVRPPRDVIQSMPDEWFLGRSETGWMRSEIFFEYVANAVNSWLEKNSVPKPVLLLVDGHKSHLTLELSKFCNDNQIILYSLPPNTTHLMQPADVSVFRPLKVEWRKTIREWQGNSENYNSVLSKSTFCPLLNKVLQKDMTDTIKNGFRKCGLFPFNPDAVDYTKCIQNTLERAENTNKNHATTPKDAVTFNREEIIIAQNVIKSIKKQLEDENIDALRVIEIIEASLVADNRVATVGNYILNSSGVLELDSDPQPSTSGYEANEFQITDSIVNCDQEDAENNSFVPIPDDDFESLDMTNLSNFSLLSSPTSIITNTVNTPPPLPTTPLSCVNNKIKSGISPSFRNHLFTPKCLQYGKRKLKPGEQMPMAISSDAWKNYMTEKEEVKQALVKKRIERQEAIQKRKEEQAKKIEERTKRKEEQVKRKGNTDKYQNLRRKAGETNKKLKVSSTQSKISSTGSEEELNSDVVDDDLIKSKISCTGCEEELISDVEDEDLKNVGCDICPRWYHLKCTQKRGTPYAEVASKEFTCHICLLTTYVDENKIVTIKYLFCLLSRHM